jgi:hypothetical protein
MMKATDLRFLDVLNAAETLDDLEKQFRDVAPDVQIEIDADGQIVICTGRFVSGPDRKIKR